MSQRVVVKKVEENKYEATVEGRTDIKGTGYTIFEAFGNLVFTNQRAFGLFVDLSQA